MIDNPRVRAAIAVAGVVLALAAAWILGRATRPSATTGTLAVPSLSGTPLASGTTPTASSTSSSTASAVRSTATPAGPHSAVEAGRKTDLGYARSGKTTGSYVHLGFDRATLFTGKAANDHAPLPSRS